MWKRFTEPVFPLTVFVFDQTCCIPDKYDFFYLSFGEKQHIASHT